MDTPGSAVADALGVAVLLALGWLLVRSIRRLVVLRKFREPPDPRA